MTDKQVDAVLKTPSPIAMATLAKAFLDVGERHSVESFKKAGTTLRAQAIALNEKQKHPEGISTHESADYKNTNISTSETQGNEASMVSKMPQSAKLKASGSTKIVVADISTLRLADAVPVALVVPILLWALLPDNSYAYYRLLRWISCPCFAYLAVEAYRRNLDGWIWVLGVTALIYNPIIPVHLNKGLWTAINVASIALAIAGTWAIRQSGNQRAITSERANYE